MNIWEVREPIYRLVPRIARPGEVIEAEDDDEEDFEVPAGEICLIVQMEVSSGRGAYPPHRYDCFGIAGTPRDIWNALGALQQALPVD